MVEDNPVVLKWEIIENGRILERKIGRTMGKITRNYPIGDDLLVLREDG
jgi:hypothetical protein